VVVSHQKRRTPCGTVDWRTLFWKASLLGSVSVYVCVPSEIFLPVACFNRANSAVRVN
jgi:hypothetical protein